MRMMVNIERARRDGAARARRFSIYFYSIVVAIRLVCTSSTFISTPLRLTARFESIRRFR